MSVAIVVDEVAISIEVSNDAPSGAATPASPAADRQTIINECVERVLDILKQKAER